MKYKAFISSYSYKRFNGTVDVTVCNLAPEGSTSTVIMGASEHGPKEAIRNARRNLARAKGVSLKEIEVT